MFPEMLGLNNSEYQTEQSVNAVVRERVARPQEAQETRGLSQGDLSQPIAAPLRAPKQTVLTLGRFLVSLATTKLLLYLLLRTGSAVLLHQRPRAVYQFKTWAHTLCSLTFFKRYTE